MTPSTNYRQFLVYSKSAFSLQVFTFMSLIVFIVVVDIRDLKKYVKHVMG
jgi:hypothetical protein